MMQYKTIKYHCLEVAIYWMFIEELLKYKQISDLWLLQNSI